MMIERINVYLYEEVKSMKEQVFLAGGPNAR